MVSSWYRNVPDSGGIPLDAAVPRSPVARRTRSVVFGVLVGLVTFLAGAVFTVLEPTSYTAVGVIALAPRPQTGVSADSTLLIAGTYQRFLSSAGEIRNTAIGNQLDPIAVSNGVTVSIDSGTADIRIEQKLDSPHNAAAEVNSLLNDAFIKGANDPLVTADIVAPAIESPIQTGPPRELYFAFSLIMGALLGSTVGYVLFRRARF